MVVVFAVLVNKPLRIDEPIVAPDIEPTDIKVQNYQVINQMLAIVFRFAVSLYKAKIVTVRGEVVVKSEELTFIKLLKVMAEGSI